MTILGRGDLSPRRKRRNWRRRSAVLVVVVIVIGGGYFGYEQVFAGSGGSAQALPLCPAPTRSAPPTEQARVVVKNATLTTGLASDVAEQLRRRNFKIASVGNTLFRGKGVATVDYSANLVQAAQLLGAQFDGATLDQVSGSNVLEVDIGPKFHDLVPVARAQAAEQDILGTPTPTPTPSASPSCRA
ncbi:MAG TPA: LytR C-terminal domain-containing protein [Mycobacteriales bacterium]|nr:LytR C-terminal domain-containing protein [Mycobacteriales bacterium]